MTLSILIVNWNSKDYLRRCLDAINRTCLRLSPQIIVVDGGSFDGCGEMLSSEFPRVEFVQNPTNGGFSNSNNLGFRRVRGEALLLLNPDTEVLPGAVDELLKQLGALPRAGILGGRLLNSDRSLQTSAVQTDPTPLNQALSSEFLYRLFPNSSLWGISAIGKTEPTQVPAVSGACMLMHASTYRSIGGLNPRYFMYAEDMDICLKVRRAGLNVYYVPSAEIVHHGGRSSAQQFNKFSTVLMREAILLYFQENHNAWRGFAYRIFLAFSALIRLLITAFRYGFTGQATRPSARVSLQKWATILNWSLGGESWARAYRRRPSPATVP